ncbi:hypothetical protein HDU93_005651, partial [Gonapodya sp. JEL0774]
MGGRTGSKISDSVVGGLIGAVNSHSQLHDGNKHLRHPDLAPAADLSTAPSRVSGTSSAVHLSAPTTNSNPRRPSHIPGVGWCLRAADGHFTMLFDDGVEVQVEAGSQSVVWRNVDGSGEEERYEISRKVPAKVKEKLRFFV